MRIARHILSWVLALFLIAMFLQTTIGLTPDEAAGSVKFWDAPGENIVFATLADCSGYPIFEPTGRLAVGIAELLAALLLILPFTRRLGGFLSFLILAGAVGFHLSPWLGREVPISLAPGNAATDGGALFMLAIAMLVASVLLIAVHPRRSEE